MRPLHMDSISTPVRELTPEEKNDLRRRVLMGLPLSLEEARSVIMACRTGAGIANTTAGSKKKTKKNPGISDEQLDADLAGLGL